MAKPRKIGLGIGGTFVCVSAGLTGYIAGTYMGIAVQARLAEIAAQIAAGLEPEQTPELLKATQVIGPLLFGLLGLALLIGGRIKGNEDDWKGTAGPGMMIAGTALMTMAIITGIAQTVEQATTQQIEAIAISAGVIAALAIAAFAIGNTLDARMRMAVRYEKMV